MTFILELTLCSSAKDRQAQIHPVVEKAWYGNTKTKPTAPRPCRVGVVPCSTHNLQISGQEADAEEEEDEVEQPTPTPTPR